MKSLTLQSPAKLNLYLKIHNKRKDGFHNLTTLFERIDLKDEIQFESNDSGKIRISCDHPHVPTGPKNLVHKAVRLIQKDLNITKGVDIVIRKNIPVAAGLAGGSSNAATALLGLNKIWKLRLKREKLAEYAAQLGSDVAFFIYGYRWAIGRGRGEKIEKIDLSAKLWHILVVPRIKMYSKEVYGRLKLSLTKKTGNVNILIHNLKDCNMLGVSQIMVNDLESVVIRLSPKLLKLKERLKSLNAKGVMVSGSGPSVFGLTESRSEAESAKKALLKKYSQVFVVKTL